MHPVERYLADLRSVRTAGGVPETSGYPCLKALLDEVGGSFKPKVVCVLHPGNSGAGIVDAGLFEKSQVNSRKGEVKKGQVPLRGVIEIKSVTEPVSHTIGTEQITRYVAHYGQVLVTNYREFALLVRTPEGSRKVDGFALADSADAFWALADHPRKAAEAHGVRFLEFLRRALHTSVTLTNPKDVAWFLASYAREALEHLSDRSLPGLDNVRHAFEEALGVTFTGEKGDHFFRSSLVQTLFYGVFSAWVLWSREQGAASRTSFDWRDSAWTLRVPMIRALFEQVATPTALGQLGLKPYLDRTGEVLNRVDHDAFFATFQLGEAVQYFYEPFLEAFDPELRKELGVWYTPKEIVQYQVARVDWILRTELRIQKGLADPSVYVLDPCCGTGAYLVEVLRKIQDTLAAAGTDALVAGDIRKAARDRVFGFEILPASFVVAHLQLGLLLNELGAPLTADGDRAGIFLTNALTGWEGGDHNGPQPFPELAQERERAEEVKQTKPILVILGNPPYHAFAGVAEGEEAGLVDPYKDELNTRWGVRKYNLDDLYVRFFRIAERKIVEMTGRGVVSFISNYSYLTEASFVQMRQRLMNGFDRMWFDNLNGDSRRTGKVAPDGSPDPSVFSTESNRAGIRVGTAVCVLARTTSEPTSHDVKVREFWGSSKTEELLASLENEEAHPYNDVTPTAQSRYRFAQSERSEEYAAWPAVEELTALPPQNGLLEKRGGSLIDIDGERLRVAMEDYFNPAVDSAAYRAAHSALTDSAAGFDPEVTRSRALQHERFDPNMLQTYAIRPFDSRSAYYTAFNPIWNRARPGLAPHVWDSNFQLIVRKTRTASLEGFCVSVTTRLGDGHYLSTDAYYVPMQLRNQAHVDRDALFKAPPASQVIPNLSAKALHYLAAVEYVNDDPAEFARVIWEHALAVAHSSAYNTEHFDDLGRGFPRVPLPSKHDLLRSSASLGHQLALLLDTELPGAADVRACLAHEYPHVGTLSAAGGRALDAERGDLAVTAGWGIRGKGGVTMPGRGKVTERADGALDIWLNDCAHWANVPKDVWEYTLGGYQVIKKWLSYREKALLGRDLTVDEARYVSEMIRRIAAILALGPALDENYERVQADAFDWSSVS